MQKKHKFRPESLMMSYGYKPALSEGAIATSLVTSPVLRSTVPTWMLPPKNWAGQRLVALPTPSIWLPTRYTINRAFSWITIIDILYSRCWKYPVYQNSWLQSDQLFVTSIKASLGQVYWKRNRKPLASLTTSSSSTAKLDGIPHMKW